MKINKLSIAGRSYPQLFKYLAIMKTIVLLVCVSFFQVSANSYAQTVTLSKRNVSIVEVFREIKKQTNYNLICNSDIIKNTPSVSIDVNNVSLQDALKKVLAPNGLSYVIENDAIVVKKAHVSIKAEARTLEVQQGGVTGKITDGNGDALIGVSVRVKGKSTGSTTNSNGQFSIDAQNGDVLIFSYIGFVDQELILGNERNITIQLREDMSSLEEVVVTALGIKREEKALGYSVQKVKGDLLQNVKGVDIGTTLTGRVAGLQVLNSSEFNQTPTMTLRGATPLLVIDGVPYGNLTLRDISSDDIESMDILKGATAAALYGARGSNGAIIITTKRGMKEKGFTVSVNSNTMISSGFLSLPEVQTSYSSGYNGKYNTDDYVWGDKLDIGRMYEQWDPELKGMREMELTSRGKDNFKNFLEFSYITNNNVSIAQQGENGSFRASLTNILNKGQYPNAKLNMTTFSVGGDMKVNDQFTLDANMSFNRRATPNINGTGYNDQGYIYNILVWTGPEYDLSKYKDYWLVPDEQQNWHYNAWYDNPYLIANEKLMGQNRSVFNTSLSATYKASSWANILFRTGYDYYSEIRDQQNPMGIYGTRGGWSGFHSKGKYWVQNRDGFSTNSDLILTTDNSFGDFKVEGLLGGTIYYYEDHTLTSGTNNGLSIPGFYSLRASIEPATTGEDKFRKQVNSAFGKATVSWRNSIFLDITGRNDWSSTLPSETRSYFYPSFASSVVLSELVDMPSWINHWRVRGSWAESKKDLGVYAINQTYSVSNNVWDGMNSARYPSTLRDPGIKPTTERTYEFGTAFSFLKNRIYGDVTYYNKYQYNLQVEGAMSSTSGFEAKLVNTKESYVRKGVEITLGGRAINKDDFKWDINFNWAQSKRFYKDLDPVFSADRPWVKAGARVDAYTMSDWEMDPNGNVIHRAGLPVGSEYTYQIGWSDPLWNWGLSNTFTYKHFSLGLSFDGRFKGLSNSGTNSRLWQTGAHIDSDTKERYEEVVNGNKTYVGEGVKIVSGAVKYDQYGGIVEDTRVFAPNDEIVSFETYWRRSYSGRRSVWDETFIKLREVSLRYALPSRIANSIGAKNASVAFVGQNVLLWSKEYKFSDPDKASDDLNSPSVRYLGVNLNINF